MNLLQTADYKTMSTVVSSSKPFADFHSGNPGAGASAFGKESLSDCGLDAKTLDLFCSSQPFPTTNANREINFKNGSFYFDSWRRPSIVSCVIYIFFFFKPASNNYWKEQRNFFVHSNRIPYIEIIIKRNDISTDAKHQDEFITILHSLLMFSFSLFTVRSFSGVFFFKGKMAAAFIYCCTCVCSAFKRLAGPPSGHYLSLRLENTCSL